MYPKTAGHPAVFGYTNEHNNQRPNERQLRTNSEVTSEKIDSLVEDLRAVLRYYRSVQKLLNNNLIDVNYKDASREHGTEVTSIIVDGPRLNPWLDDGCGRFRVKHYGVCAERIQTARLVHKIKAIVSENPDIHVWNLSLGTEDEKY
ncbi:MAG: hypothetical protein IJK86_03075 [Lachnospiraceae bacterium]|nr:hypothetical protein [Lachnospiraceae bacterium]